MTRRPSRLLAFVLSSALAMGVTIFVTTERAAACSCIVTSLYNKVGISDIAFTGRMTSSTPTGDALYADLEFDVEHVVKGQAASAVHVRTAQFGSACGASFDLGELVGVLVTRREDGLLETSSCISPVDANALLDPALLQPPGNALGATKPIVAAAGRFGPGTVFGADASARLGAVGVGGKTPAALAACPGGRRVATVDEHEVVAFDALTFAVVDRVTVPPRSDGSPNFNAESFRCLDEDGTSFAWVLQRTSSEPPVVRRLTAGRFTAVPLLADGYVAELDATATLVFGSSADHVARLQSATTGQVLGTVDLPAELVNDLAFDATGTRLALVTRPDDMLNPGPFPSDAPTSLRIVELSPTGISAVSVPRPFPGPFVSDLSWVDDHTLLGNVSLARIFEARTDGTETWSVPFGGGRGLVEVDGSYYVGGKELVRVRRDGTTENVTDGALTMTAVVVIPPRAAVPPTSPPTPAPTSPAPAPVVVTPRFTG